MLNSARFQNCIKALWQGIEFADKQPFEIKSLPVQCCDMSKYIIDLIIL